MTNMIITPDQTQGTCPEDPELSDVKCTEDSNCTAMEPVKYGHGKLVSQTEIKIKSKSGRFPMLTLLSSIPAFHLINPFPIFFCEIALNWLNLVSVVMINICSFSAFLHIQNVCFFQYNRFISVFILCLYLFCKKKCHYKYMYFCIPGLDVGVSIKYITHNSTSQNVSRYIDQVFPSNLRRIKKLQ